MQTQVEHSGRRTFLVAVAAGLATLLLYAFSLFRPRLSQDDIEILVRSTDWPTTWANLWVSANEHVMPPGRVTTWLLIHAAGSPTMLPLVGALQGVLALLIAMALVFVFVRRERGHPFYGLIAMILFGVSTVYVQAITWFAASFQVLALGTLLLGLLAAQRWRQTNRMCHLVLCVFWCALAPAWFASGILAGPFCCVYLLIHTPLIARLCKSSPNDEEAAAGPLPIVANSAGTAAHSSLATSRWPLATALLPLLGSALFLSLSLPRAFERIMHLEHYGEKGLFQSFQPLVGITYTGRSLVENLVLGTFGLSGIDLPRWIVIFALMSLLAIAIWWWRRSPTRQLLILGLAFMFFSYIMIYSARADFIGAVHMNHSNWSRYHLFPQLGLSLFVVGGLRLQTLDAVQGLTKKQTRGLLLLVCTMFVVQLPRGVLSSWPVGTSPEEQLVLLRTDPSAWFRNAVEDWRKDALRNEQYRVLQQIEAMDVRCREQRIAAATARAGLGHLSVPGCTASENGWDLLKGSNNPLPFTVDEVREMLAK